MDFIQVKKVPLQDMNRFIDKGTGSTSNQAYKMRMQFNSAF